MAFCAFDEGAAGFDVTPVENMFISEYMLGAPGEYVKVYLYGLMLCYHSQARMSLSSMARDLKATEEEIERAFRYWERNGLVRRVGDNPVAYAFRNIKQLTLTRAQDPAEKLYNRAFMDEVRRTLGDKLFESGDLNRIFDWMEVYEFSEEVVLLLLRHEMKKSKGRFSFGIADKTAREWAHRGVRTAEDVEQLVLMDDARKASLIKLLSRLGLRHEPSEDEKQLYSKWVDEWGFDEEAIQEACRETLKGVPTMAYLDGILLRQHQLGRHTLWEVRKGIALEKTGRDFARAVFAALGRVGVTPSAQDSATIDGWQQSGFSQEIILMAANEEHARGRNTLEDVDAKLTMWQKQGFATPEQVSAARMRVKALNGQLREIYAAAGMEKRVNQPDRDLLARWMGELGMSMELVLLAAEYARGTGSPMKMADRILSDWKQAGISTADEARAEHEAHVRTGGGARAAANPRTQKDTMLRHDYTDEDYRGMMVDLDEEDEG